MTVNTPFLGEDDPSAHMAPQPAYEPSPGVCLGQQRSPSSYHSRCPPLDLSRCPCPLGHCV
jgi:hypothetical protein